MYKSDEAVKLWQNWRVQSEADIDRRLENFRVLFAYNSGKIENDAITSGRSQKSGRLLLCQKKASP